MPAKTLMIQGTASSVGKSLLTTALCRIFKQQGLKVAPFKAWNMALNSAVTSEGLEIGRAQAAQAEACGVPPSADMNPVLIKCEAGHRMQVIVMGKVVASMTGEEYRRYVPQFKPAIEEALGRLRSQFDLVVLEGAGSPVELNLQGRDLANMFTARLADAPVILVGDIERGGVFASLLGTLELLEPSDRSRVKALVINKFRGSLEHLEPGLKPFRERTGLPLLGVLPYISGLGLAEEDSVALEEQVPAKEGLLTIAVLKFPHISNFDEFQPLARTSGLGLRYVQSPSEAQEADLIILPGTKATVADLQWLRASGFEPLLKERVKNRRFILGICGGYQMLGQVIEDPDHVESGESTVKGLGLLPVSTRFEKEKVTAQVEAAAVEASPLTQSLKGGKVRAYEIHMGRVKTKGAQNLFQIVSHNGQGIQEAEGAVEGVVMGTLLHGLFENDPVRQSLLAALGKEKGIEMPVQSFDKEADYDRLADMVRRNLDIAFLDRLIKG